MAGVYTVAQLNSYIAKLFASEYVFRQIAVKGEISNCKYHQTGNLYFTLKDENAAISCMMGAADSVKMSFRLKDGMSVIVSGRVGVYEKGGTYRLYARSIRQEGMGALYEKYLALKQELGEMGMFDPSYKKPIPPFISRLGVVTAPTGDAVRDIIEISRRNHPGIQIFLYPAKVQGEGAAESIVQGIRMMEKIGVETIIIGRGGGSLEDLWAFNEEIVARAVFSCSVPIISAVGHESDWLISDFAADLRAPTPTAAANMAVPDMMQVLTQIDESAQTLNISITEKLKMLRERVTAQKYRLAASSPEARLAAWKERKEQLTRTLLQRMQLRLDQARSAVEIQALKLDALSPAKPLERGYAWIEKKDGSVVKSSGALARNEEILIHMNDGSRAARVLDSPAKPDMAAGV